MPKQAKPALDLPKTTRIKTKAADKATDRERDDKIEAFANNSVTALQKEPLRKSVKKKVVSTKRENYTLPVSEFEILQRTVTRSGLAGRALNKSEILRAGILALDAMTDNQFKKSINRVERVKTGRPGADDE